MDRVISQSRGLRGTVSVPGDKSISHRALMIGALAEGSSEISGFLDAADPRSTLHCLASLGANFQMEGSLIKVHGTGLSGLRPPKEILDAGNSGTTIRLLTGILAGQPFRSAITGDDSLRQRPMKRIIEPLSRMGAKIQGSELQTAPLIIEGVSPLHAMEYAMPMSSAQVKSAVLLAGLFAEGTTRVVEKTQTRDHTERMLGLKTVPSAGAFVVEVNGGMQVPAQRFHVPGDVSSAAFLISAALLVPNSELRILNVGLNPTRTRIIDFFRSVGGSIETERESIVAGEPIGDLLVRTSPLQGSVELQGRHVAELIDEIPILSVTLALSGCSLVVRGAADLRHKESDRIRALVLNLRKTGLEVEEYPDGFAFQPKNTLIAAACDSFSDHRIAMAFGVAGLVLKGKTMIKESECVDISFPSFWQLLGSLERR
ncbi:MAG: 3-phosphoshikimate 1-carboxyvinyltransferase [Ignavibacteriales bacterium]|nr:3-phosphoshikimate 1-carboxyvinyltransferase [Ignavibacteriales bacterium]